MREPDSFRCIRCKQQVTADVFGTAHRNHCPNCLWSKHVDDFPGDRKSACQGAMEPLAVGLREGEWVLIHQCRSCHVLHDNRIAGDDNMAVLLAIAARPLANPPVPLEYLPPA